MILNWITLTILLLATSCVGMSIDAESSHNSQATKTERRPAVP